MAKIRPCDGGIWGNPTTGKVFGFEDPTCGPQHNNADFDTWDFFEHSPGENNHACGGAPYFPVGSTNSLEFVDQNFYPTINGGFTQTFDPFSGEELTPGGYGGCLFSTTTEATFGVDARSHRYQFLDPWLGFTAILWAYEQGLNDPTFPRPFLHQICNLGSSVSIGIFSSIETVGPATHPQTFKTNIQWGVSMYCCCDFYSIPPFETIRQVTWVDESKSIFPPNYSELAPFCPGVAVSFNPVNQVLRILPAYQRWNGDVILLPESSLQGNLCLKGGIQSTDYPEGEEVEHDCKMDILLRDFRNPIEEPDIGPTFFRRLSVSSGPTVDLASIMAAGTF